MSDENSFKDDILECAEDEPIEAIVIGEYGWSGFREDNKGVPEEKTKIVLTWEEASGFLDYSYDTGFGGPECHAILAWTKSWIIYVVQYDGSTNLCRMHRNPVDHLPSMPGG